MRTDLLERVRHLVKEYHLIDEESEKSQVNWDTVMLKHGLDGCGYAHALTELYREAGDYLKAELLREKYGTWAAHPDYPMADWYYEVANGDTRLGYWEWVVCRLERDFDAMTET